LNPIAIGPTLYAQSKGAALTGNPPSALDQFQEQATKTLNAAVTQGQHDVGAVTSTTGTAAAEYVDQAKALASSAISTAQVQKPRVSLVLAFSLYLFSRIFPRASADRPRARTAILDTTSLLRYSLAPLRH
jgi:hypothetical protein